MKVLVVDDNKATARIIQQVITSKDHGVMTAGDGLEGYNAYLDFRPDLVITDIEMPGKNGFELVKAIRAHNPKIRTVYMSGHLERFHSLIREEKMRYHTLTLGKPFSLDELLKIVSDTPTTP